MLTKSQTIKSNRFSTGDSSREKFTAQWKSAIMETMSKRKSKREKEREQKEKRTIGPGFSLQIGDYSRDEKRLCGRAE
jgi:hypothetical protein